MTNETIGDLENEMGFLIAREEELEDMLSAVREQKLRVQSELLKARMEASNE